MDECLANKTPDRRQDDAVVLFSGGRDSSLTACLLLNQGKKVHLITCFDGALLNMDIADYRYREIENAFPASTILRKILPTYGLFRRIALEDIEADFEKYKKNLIILGSQLATLSTAILYCLRNSITIIASGFTKYEATLPEQMAQAIDLFRSFALEFGIAYITPVYEYSSSDEVKYHLFDFGISTKSLEPFSIFSDTASEPAPDLVSVYINDKLSICRKFLEMMRSNGQA